MTLPDPKTAKAASGNQADASAPADNQTAKPTLPQEGEGTDAALEEEFNKDRALETIRKQRESERALQRSLREAQARLEQYDKAAAAKADAEKSDLQKAQEKVTTLEKALQESQETTQALLLKQGFMQTARKLKLTFAPGPAEDDAFELADLTDVEITEKGEITGLEDAIKKLQSDRPYLFTVDAGNGKSGDGLGSPKKGNTGKLPANQGQTPPPKEGGFKIRF